MGRKIEDLNDLRMTRKVEDMNRLKQKFAVNPYFNTSVFGEGI
ncbi:MAG TPA: hypothetical protein VFE88_02190 [Candidatus Nanoarchaeia archaeon]|nr:hypothetical protein [Candidatus Nanoarchaeia archaeon]